MTLYLTDAIVYLTIFYFLIIITSLLGNALYISQLTQTCQFLKTVNLSPFSLLIIVTLFLVIVSLDLITATLFFCKQDFIFCNRGFISHDVTIFHRLHLTFATIACNYRFICHSFRLISDICDYFLVIITLDLTILFLVMLTLYFTTLMLFIVTVTLYLTNLTLFLVTVTISLITVTLYITTMTLFLVTVTLSLLTVSLYLTNRT